MRLVLFAQEFHSELFNLTTRKELRVPRHNDCLRSGRGCDVGGISIDADCDGGFAAACISQNGDAEYEYSQSRFKSSADTERHRPRFLNPDSSPPLPTTYTPCKFNCFKSDDTREDS